MKTVKELLYHFCVANPEFTRAQFDEAMRTELVDAHPSSSGPAITNAKKRGEVEQIRRGLWRSLIWDEENFPSNKAA
jgi:hypothetical protein